MPLENSVQVTRVASRKRPLSQDDASQAVDVTGSDDDDDVIPSSLSNDLTEETPRKRLRMPASSSVNTTDAEALLLLSTPTNNSQALPDSLSPEVDAMGVRLSVDENVTSQIINENLISKVTCNVAILQGSTDGAIDNCVNDPLQKKIVETPQCSSRMLDESVKDSNEKVAVASASKLCLPKLKLTADSTSLAGGNDFSKCMPSIDKVKLYSARKNVINFNNLYASSSISERESLKMKVLQQLSATSLRLSSLNEAMPVTWRCVVRVAGVQLQHRKTTSAPGGYSLRRRQHAIRSANTAFVYDCMEDNLPEIAEDKTRDATDNDWLPSKENRTKKKAVANVNVKRSELLTASGDKNTAQVELPDSDDDLELFTSKPNKANTNSVNKNDHKNANHNKSLEERKASVSLSLKFDRALHSSASTNVLNNSRSSSPEYNVPSSSQVDVGNDNEVLEIGAFNSSKRHVTSSTEHVSNKFFKSHQHAEATCSTPTSTFSRSGKIETTPGIPKNTPIPVFSSIMQKTGHYLVNSLTAGTSGYISSISKKNKQQDDQDVIRPGPVRLKGNTGLLLNQLKI